MRILTSEKLACFSLLLIFIFTLLRARTHIYLLRRLIKAVCYQVRGIVLWGHRVTLRRSSIDHEVVRLWRGLHQRRVLSGRSAVTLINLLRRLGRWLVLTLLG